MKQVSDVNLISAEQIDGQQSEKLAHIALNLKASQIKTLTCNKNWDQRHTSFMTDNLTDIN